MTLAKDLKAGDEITIEGETFKIKDIKVSNLGKHGRSKTRIEAEKDGEIKIIIKPSEEEIETK